MNELKIFENPKFGQVRTIEENGKVLFCGSDVAKALGYKNAPDALNRHCRAIVKRDTPVGGKIQAINFISEGDIYRLAAKSELPGAEEFESWIFDEVLPSIRRTGGYIAGQESMSDSELMAKALIVAQRQIEERNRQLEEAKPKVLFADAVSASKSSILIGDLAKLLKQNGIEIGQKRLFDWMRNKGYLIKQKGASWNMPTQRSMERGLFEIKETTVTHSDGHISVSKTAKVTGKGQVFFVSRFLENSLLN